MRINNKQQQLIDEFLSKVKKLYPEVELIDIESSPEDPEHIWINVISGMDEDREIEMRLYASEIATDILTDYGYSFSIMPENKAIIYS